MEERRFVESHPRSAELAADAREHLLAGVPMPWMTRWPGAFPLFVAEANGARFTDVDGNEFVDFCLGDTGAMTGHALPQVADAIARQAERGITTMLPTTDAAWVAGELARRFRLPSWQMAMTATDANRFVLRFARHLTGRPKICVMDWCYHGTVDETLAILDAAGHVIARPGSIGPQVDPALTTRVVPFNDLDALDAALAHGDVAAVLMEPALTNIGIVLPDPGYHDGVREITRRHGTLLVIDETHTICAGPGGCTAAWDLEPDFFVIGKPIAGGVPAAAYGMTADIAARLAGPAQRARGRRVRDRWHADGECTRARRDAGDAVERAARRRLRGHDPTRHQMGRRRRRRHRQTPGWRGHVQRLGCRAEYWFCPPPRNGAEAAAAVDEELDAFMHLWAMNRGILLTPFHNMALLSPFHTETAVDRHTEVFAEAVAALLVTV